MIFFIAENLWIDKKSSHTFPLIEEYYRGNINIKVTSNFEAATVVIIPTSIPHLFKHNKQKQFFEIAYQVKTTGKKLMVFSGGDYGISFKEPYIYQIRLGGFKSRMTFTTFIMPPFIEDPYNKLPFSFSSKAKENKPTVGFVGHCDGTLLKFLKELILHYKNNVKRFLKKDFTDKQAFYPSSHKRYKNLQLLQKSSLLITNFSYKNKYRAGAKTAEEIQQTSLLFYENIYHNIYTVCIRGTGNFSVRFYETLAMGRIPVLIDTDCKLPFETTIPWQKHILKVEASQIKNIPTIINRFHSSKTDEEISEIQKSNRNLWRNYFTRKNYFNLLLKQLRI